MNRHAPTPAAGPLMLAALIFVAALTRVIPHPPNFSPIEAVALFGGAYFAKRHWALLVPLAAMFVSDLVLGLAKGGLYWGYFATAGYLLVYAAIVLSTLLGFGLRGKATAGRVLTRKRCAHPISARSIRPVNGLMASRHQPTRSFGTIWPMSNHDLTRWVLRYPWSRGVRRAGAVPR